MQNWVRLRWPAAFTFLLLLATFAAPAAAQVRIVPPAGESATADVVQLQDLLEQGRQLELQRRWGEALTLYEDALRDHPGESDLRRRFDLAKLHYDLGRRYADNSFQHAVAQMGDADALEVYSDVLLKVQSHYVHRPDWARLVAWGTSSLEVALTDADFVDQHLDRVPQDRIDRFRNNLRHWVGQQQITGRHTARDVVAAAARMTRDHLGLPVPVSVMEYTCGATNSLDDYSAYLTPDQLGDVYSQIDGNFVGLGVELKADGNSLLIVNVITGSPAQQSGVRAGDRIVAVDGHSTGDMTTDEAAGLLQGEEGSLVELTVATANQSQRTVTVRRAHVEVPSVDRVRLVDESQGIGYLRLTCFQKTTSRDLDAALWDLHRQGMQCLIMDLRGNPGGLLSSAVEVADKFVDRGTIVSTRGRNPHEDFNYSAHHNGTWGIPLVVLIDGDSASASEIFAGAMHELGRATIVGNRSYGKGSVQGIFPLKSAHGLRGAGLRLTTAKFYSPAGHPYSKVGVQPDVQVRVTARPADGQIVGAAFEQNDPYISAAVGVAQQQVARR